MLVYFYLMLGHDREAVEGLFSYGWIKIFLWVYGLLWPSLTDAQQPLIRAQVITVEDGLSNGMITSMMRGPDRCMWFGTRDGLNQYNGHHIKQYLPDEEVYDIALVSATSLWITTNKGLHIYNVQEGTIAKAEGLQHSGIQHMETIGEGHMLLANHDTLYEYDQGGIRPVFILSQQKETSNPTSTYASFQINDVAIGPNGNIWLATLNSGIYQLDTKFNVLRNTNFGWWAKRLAGGHYTTLIQQLEHLINPDVLHDPASEVQLEKYPVSIHLLHKTNTNFLWFNSFADQRLHGFDLVHEQAFSLQPDGMTFHNDATFYSDERGVLWVGTTDGVVRVEAKRSMIRHLLDPIPGESKLAASTRGMIEDKHGKIYMATYHGIFVWEEKKDTLYRLSNYGTATDNRCYALLDEDSCFWCASESFGLLRYDKQQQKMRVIPSTQGGWLLGTSLMRDQRGYLWMGTRSGLYHLNIKGDSIAKAKQVPPAFNNRIVYDMHQDQQQMWIGTDSGLYRMDPITMKVIDHYHTQAPSGYQLPHNEVLDIHQARNGHLWLGTKGGGLCRLDGQTISTYPQVGLKGPQHIIPGILEDDDGHLWLATYSGLIFFNKSNGSWRVFKEEDGISHNEFNHKSFLKKRNGALCFGGLNGINVFQPESLLTTVTPPHIILSQFTYFNQEEEINGLPNALTAGKVVLDPGVSYINLDFSLDDFSSPEKNSYAYQLKGLIEEWQYLGPQHALLINRPSPGDYELRIKGMGGEGVWSVPFLLKITVTPTLFERPIFWVICVVSMALLLLLLTRWRLQQLQKANTLLEQKVVIRTQEIAAQKEQIEQQAHKLLELDDMKSRFFVNVSHELRTPLTLIKGYINRAIQNEAPIHLKEELGIAARNVNQLQELVEDILDLSKVEAGKMQIREDRVQLQRWQSIIGDNYNSMANFRGIQFLVNNSLPDPCWCLLDQEKLARIVHNLLSNAMKFTPATGSVEFKISLKEANLIFEVNDTGKGIAPENLPRLFDRYYQASPTKGRYEGGTGIGLAYSKELSKLMKGQLTVTSKEGEGTRFRLRLPYHPAKPRPHHEVDAARGEDETIQGAPVVVPREALILLVEDNPDMSTYVQASLGPQYNYLLAADGLAALELLAQHAVDLIVSDVMMPRMDGFELAQYLKSNKETKTIPLVLLTARADAEDRVHGLTIGVDDYLTKPFDPRELQVRVVNLLHNRQERKEWINTQQEPAEELGSFDQAFVQQAAEIVHKEISNTQFGVIDLAEQLMVSQRTLTRKMRSTSGLSPLKFINEVRLQRAFQIMEQRHFETVAEVMHAVGFQAGGHFAKVFEQRFGKKPSDFLDKKRPPQMK